MPNEWVNENTDFVRSIKKNIVFLVKNLNHKLPSVDRLLGAGNRYDTILEAVGNGANLLFFLLFVNNWSLS